MTLRYAITYIALLWNCLRTWLCVQFLWGPTLTQSTSYHNNNSNNNNNNNYNNDNDDDDDDDNNNKKPMIIIITIITNYSENPGLQKGSSLLSYCPALRFGESAWCLDHPKNLTSCSLYNCRAILKMSSKSCHNLLSNGWPNFQLGSYHGDQNRHQNVIIWFFYYPRPLYKISITIRSQLSE